MDTGIVEVVDLLNTTAMDIVLADNTGNWGTVRGGEVLAGVDKSILTKECVASPIRKGWLKVKQVGSGGKFAGVKGIKRNAKTAAADAKTKVSTEPVSFFPENPEQAVNAKVTTFDFEKAAAEAAEKNAIENIGQKLVKKGRKKKLVNVNVQKGGPRHVVEMPSRVKKQLPNVVEIDGSKGQNPLKGAQMVISSTIPGAAQLVSLEDMGWDSITKLANETNKLVDSLAQERKISMYANHGKTQKSKVIEATTDLGFLRQIEEGETDEVMLKKVRARIEALEGTDV